MPGIARYGVDVAGGYDIHDSPSVFANNNPVVRIGDQIAGHGRSPHDGPVMVSGSSNVFINNIPTCREGDIASCDHPTSGSGNVFVN